MGNQHSGSYNTGHQARGRRQTTSSVDWQPTKGRETESEKPK